MEKKMALYFYLSLLEWQHARAQEFVLGHVFVHQGAMHIQSVPAHLFYPCEVQEQRM